MPIREDLDTPHRGIRHMGALEILIAFGLLICVGACVGPGRKWLESLTSERRPISAGEELHEPTVERIEEGIDVIERRLQTLEDRADFTEALLVDHSEEEKEIQ
jgi:hypothetical protein